MIRFAIISSPRSGNTWVRNVLGSALNISTDAKHNYDEFNDISGSLGIQIHWPREPNFQKFLQVNAFQPIVVSRHPLDILCSMMHFIRYEPMTSRWLEGNVAIPSHLKGRSPACSAFLEYATSFGAENLLSVTYQWWHEPAALKLRYETAVSGKENAFALAFEKLGLSASDFSGPLAKHDLAAFQATHNHHGWQGRPGLWRDIVPRNSARAIYQRHRHIFDALEYSVDEAIISDDEALGRWEQLVA